MTPRRGRGVGHRADEGSVTAEFAIALPAIVLVLAACIGALQLASAHVRLQDAAALAARAAARGDDAGGAAAAVTTADVAVWRDGALVCAAARSPARWAPGLPPFELSARSCSLDGG